MSESSQPWDVYLEDFWALTVDVWNRGVFGVDLGQILIAILHLSGCPFGCAASSARSSSAA